MFLCNMEISLTYETEIYYIRASWQVARDQGLDKSRIILLTPRCENSAFLSLRGNVKFYFNFFVLFHSQHYKNMFFAYLVCNIIKNKCLSNVLALLKIKTVLNVVSLEPSTSWLTLIHQIRSLQIQLSVFFIMT